jgi:hypothetical protein
MQKRRRTEDEGTTGHSERQPPEAGNVEPSRRMPLVDPWAVLLEKLLEELREGEGTAEDPGGGRR